MACSHNVATTPNLSEAHTTFQQLLEEATYDAYDQVPGVSMTVLMPDLDIHWTGAAGFDSKKRTDSLSAKQPFRIASVTKTFVAAAILRLHEDQRLSIDQAIAPFLSPIHQELLREGGYDLEKITIRHCLNHSNGFVDYAMQSAAYHDQILKNPKRRWTRTEQLQLAMEIGHPMGAPGEKYHYNDTGYILLGEVIESLTDSTLAWGLRELLGFEKLGLQQTWLESLEPAPDDLLPFVHRYFRGRDFTEWDPSIDLYGGGGLVSTTDELASFIHQLFNQQVFTQRKTLDLMLEKADYDHPPSMDYRQGLSTVKVYGESVYMHEGLWGVILCHIPAYNASLAINYTHGRRDRLLKKTILVLKHLHDQQNTK